LRTRLRSARSTGCASGRSTTLISFFGGIPMSKKTAKRKLRSRRNKANHGKRPNSGRR